MTGFNAKNNVGGMGRHLAIGDIHGCFRSLMALVELIDIQDDDILVTLGDYVDRGPQSRDVIDWLISFDKTDQLIPLRGNHEEMMLASRNHFIESRRWALSGGDNTLDSYPTSDKRVAMIEDIPSDHWQFISKRLELYHETEKNIFVHGSVAPDIPMDEQLEETITWTKYNESFSGHCSGKVVVCGHTSQKSGIPTTNSRAICIDTNACRGGWLTCLDVDSGVMWQTNESQESRTFHLDDLPAMTENH